MQALKKANEDTDSGTELDGDDEMLGDGISEAELEQLVVVSVPLLV